MKNKETRDALVQDYLLRKKRLQTRFQAEKTGEADLQFEAAKLFNPITGLAEKQAIELENVTKAIEKLPAKIAAEANFNPIAALFGEETNHTPALPAPIKPEYVVDADKDLDIETIKRYKFKPPSELNLKNEAGIDDLIEGINRVNHRLGQARRKIGKTAADIADIDRDQDALRAYKSRIRLLTDGYKLTVHKGSGLKLKGNKFGNLTIDPVSLMAGRLKAFSDGGGLVLEAPADHSLFDLLTKRFVKTKSYTPAAVEAFKKLVDLSGLPIHGRKSKKHQLIRGGTIQFYNDPDTLVERLQLLVASKSAGNTGVDNEISAILDELLRIGAIPKALAVQLNRDLLIQ